MARTSSQLAFWSLWFLFTPAQCDPGSGPFSYTQVTTKRHATPLPSQLSFATPFAPPFSKASTLLPGNITYTTWSLGTKETESADGKYGQSAYAALWASYTFSHTIPFSTTVSPTPVPTTELVYPPPLYNAPAGNTSLKFRPDFMWGVAGSAWQIEGGLQSEGRGPSVLDAIGAAGVASPIPSGNDSMVSDMNYFLYKQDIARLAAIGIPTYSFSVSWTRVVPFGVADSPVNIQALEHYDDLINTCLEYGVTPVVTLSHFDMPVGLAPNIRDAEAVTRDFMYYAKIVATRYADRVPVWFTFNEPNLPASATGGSYNYYTNLLVAHATFYRWYKYTLGGTGRVSLKFANNLAYPLRGPDNADDVAASIRYQEFMLGIMGNPLFLGEQYPASVLSTAGLNMTALTDAQIALVNGTADFYAVDPYVAQLATPAPAGLAKCAANSSDPLWPHCIAPSSVQADGWLMGAPSESFPLVAPQYVRQQLGYLWRTFRPRGGIMIAEFGFPVADESTRTVDLQRYDFDRTLYYQDFLHEALKAVHEDGVDLVGALAWSFVDNNEFGSYSAQFGMQTVNRTDGTLARHYKRSMFDFVDFFHQHVSA